MVCGVFGVFKGSFLFVVIVMEIDKDVSFKSFMIEELLESYVKVLSDVVKEFDELGCFKLVGVVSVVGEDWEYLLFEIDYEFSFEIIGGSNEYGFDLEVGDLVEFLMKFVMSFLDDMFVMLMDIFVLFRVFED